jgi:hypothetical protein
MTLVLETYRVLLGQFKGLLNVSVYQLDSDLVHSRKQQPLLAPRGLDILLVLGSHRLQLRL